jgi:hypothetical protein
MMKVMVSLFVSNSHKVMTALIVMNYLQFVVMEIFWHFQWYIAMRSCLSSCSLSSKGGNLVHLWAESARRILHHLLVSSALWDLQVTQTLESTPSFHNFSAASFAPAA